MEIMVTAGGHISAEALRQHKAWLASDGAQGVRLNLQGADLRGADLRGATLRRADLRGAHLEGEAARLAAPPARRMDRRWLGECGQGCKVTRSRLTDAVRVRRWTCLEHRLPISWQWVGTDNRG